MPVLITGMHRSGTSMIARLLNLCGLYLGEQGEFIDPKPDNPRGFWEHLLFLQLDKFIVQKFGHDDVMTDEIPFLMQEGWEKDDRLYMTTLWAKRMVHSMSASSPNWGWKDPRAALLLPFWYPLIPDLKVVICLRHPLDVAASLMKRDPTIGEKESVDNWYAYMWMVDEHAKEPRMVTDYDRFFTDWHREVSRIASFCGLEPSIEQAGFCSQEIRPELRHHASGGEIPDKVQELYDKLLEEAE